GGGRVCVGWNVRAEPGWAAVHRARAGDAERANCGGTGRERDNVWGDRGGTGGAVVRRRDAGGDAALCVGAAGAKRAAVINGDSRESVIHARWSGRGLC